MIRLEDLEEAILECQGERNPNAQTCIKLAAYYTIRQEMFGNPGKDPGPSDPGGYSTQAAALSAPVRRQSETTIDYDSGSEFSRLINGMELLDVLEIMDELLGVLQATNPRLYDGVIRKIQQI